jgi:hypothetical protein
MLRLFYSNHIEDLIPPLSDSVREQQARDPLDPVTIVVPGRVMEQYVKFELAERLGVAARSALSVPGWLHRGVAPGPTSISRDRAWRVGSRCSSISGRPVMKRPISRR